MIVMKRILAAAMLVLGFSASATADGRTLFLTCVTKEPPILKYDRDKIIIDFDKKEVTWIDQWGESIYSVIITDHSFELLDRDWETC